MTDASVELAAAAASDEEAAQQTLDQSKAAWWSPTASGERQPIHRC
jgi:hypothetical protein